MGGEAVGSLGYVLYSPEIGCLMGRDKGSESGKFRLPSQKLGPSFHAPHPSSKRAEGKKSLRVTSVPLSVRVSLNLGRLYIKLSSGDGQDHTV